MSSNTSHFLLCPFIVWGHIRPFCALATRLVLEQETIITTLIVAPHALDKTRVEVSRQFLNGPSEDLKALQRIRIVSPFNYSNGVDPSATLELFANAYPAAYKTLYEAKAITCSISNTTYDAVPAPCAVILDFCAFPQLKATRAISGRSVPVIAFGAGGAGAFMRACTPESVGGVGDIGAKISAEVARTGLSADEIGPKIYYHSEGELISIPGLPVMYDYEFFPQKDRPFNSVMIEVYPCIQECDAVILATFYAYESATLDMVKHWVSLTQKKEVHALGPLLPLGYGTKTQNSEEGTSADIEAFLGQMLVQHGERSVFFVSFGSVFWLSVPEYIDELIESLIAKNAPFIFAYASPNATLSGQQADRIKSSGLGMITKWAPQEFILNHPATGWFITHGGFNSVIESLASGIPLIFVPFMGDQPFAAIQVTEKCRAGFELFQIRTGDIPKPIYRNGVTPAGTREAVGIEVRETIDLCRSKEGQEMTRNAGNLKVMFAKAWKEDGAAKKAIRNFLLKYA